MFILLAILPWLLHKQVFSQVDSHYNTPIFYSETINKASLFMHKYLKSFLLKLQQLDNKMQTLLSFKKERKLKCYKTTKQIFFIKFLLKYNHEITFI